jgi:hypothetical protein
MNSSARESRGFVVWLFFLSGFSGLIYEVVWVRWLTMFVGAHSDEFGHPFRK